MISYIGQVLNNKHQWAGIRLNTKISTMKITDQQCETYAEAIDRTMIYPKLPSRIVVRLSNGHRIPIFIKQDAES